MRRILLIGVLLSVISSAFAQKRQVSDTIEVAVFKLVKLVFHSNIIDNGFGRNDLEGEITTDRRKIKLYSLISNFPPTNYQVETEDGHYNFILIYNENPRTQFVNVTPDMAVLRKNQQQYFSSVSNNHQARKERTIQTGESTIGRENIPSEKVSADMERVSEQILRKDKNLYGVHEMKSDVYFYVKHTYVHGDSLYFTLGIYNRSNISYDVETYRFYLDDGKGKAIKRSSDGHDLIPAYWYNEIQRVEGGQTKEMVVAFDKFTMKKGEKFIIEFREAGDGERHVMLQIRDKDINKANAL